jgi:hypothetical protein
MVDRKAGLGFEATGIPMKLSRWCQGDTSVFRRSGLFETVICPAQIWLSSPMVSRVYDSQNPRLYGLFRDRFYDNMVSWRRKLFREFTNTKVPVPRQESHPVYTVRLNCTETYIISEAYSTTTTCGKLALESQELPYYVCASRVQRLPNSEATRMLASKFLASKI